MGSGICGRPSMTAPRLARPQTLRRKSIPCLNPGPGSPAQPIPARAEEALESAWQHLVREDEGLALLFTPPFDKSEPSPGYIKGYPPGVRENGGQYTHAALWLAMALARQGDGERAVETAASAQPDRARPRCGSSLALRGRALCGRR